MQSRGHKGPEYIAAGASSPAAIPQGPCGLKKKRPALPGLEVPAACHRVRVRSDSGAPDRARSPGGRRPKSAGEKGPRDARGRTRFCQIEPKFRACLNQTGSKLSSICHRLLSSVAVRFLPCDHALLACGFHADSDIPRADSTRIPIFR